MNKKQKRLLRRVILAAALFVGALFIPAEGSGKLLCFAVPYLVIGWDILYRAGRNILHGQVFDEQFLMALATVGAFAIGEYPEAVFVMLFFQIGELFESIAVGKSRKSIAALMDIRPDCACVERNGAVEAVSPESVGLGEIIVVKPGEKIPLDGVVEEGFASLDTAALTGESMPRDVEPGDTVISGCISRTGLLRIRTTKLFGESTVAKILELVENSAANKAKSENFITQFARWYTPVVVGCALLLGLLPPLLGGVWRTWIHRALVFLVVSCPCALVISVPLTFFGGIGGASKQGILVKGSNYLDALDHSEIVVLDKTGTVTCGEFEVREICAVNGDDLRLLELAALAESCSNHPAAASLRQAWGKTADRGRVSGAEEIPGFGVKAEVDGKTVLCGNGKLLARFGVESAISAAEGTVVHVAEDGIYLGFIVIADQIKENTKKAICALRGAGIRKIVMLTGDRMAAAAAVADILEIDEVYAELMPEEKVRHVERLLAECSLKGKLLFVGDGVNDAPVLSRADIGVAMGALGSDAAIEAADIVLMDDRLEKLVLAIKIARHTRRIVMENIVFALTVKLVVLLLAAIGVASLWAASFADVGVCVIAVLNAMRALKI